MGYRIEIDHGRCINCGVCMDVCPVEALDMSRPIGPGVESGLGQAIATAAMMEHPVQVGECIGCSICVRECPVDVMTLFVEAEEVSLAPRQGPIERPDVAGVGWVPLSDVTREVLKPNHPSPFDGLLSWRTAERPEAWQSWRTMTEDPTTVPKAPCQVACPAGTDAGRYVGLIGEGRYDEAYAVAAEVNPFPSVCGWICTAPCEVACRRDVLDEPIAIRTLKRFAAENGRLPEPPAPARRRTELVAIVGGGPAGMSAGFYLARLGYPVTVFEAMPVPGGMMAIGIPEYRLPREVLRAEIDRIVAAGVELRTNSAMGRDFTLGDLERQGYRAVFLATGASKSRPLGVPGDDLAGVVPATVFLKQVNLGEHPRLSGPVVVVGGGSTAIDAARSAWRSGASSVMVIYRRGRDDMPAQAEEIAEAEREGVAITPATVVTEVIGRDGSVVAVRCEAQRATGRSDSGRTTWEPAPDSVTELSARTVLVAIGEEPDPSILPEGAGIEVSGWAGIAADPRTLATGRAGVFAGGDVVSGPKTIIDAVAAGRRAAASIHEYLADVADGEAAVFRAVRYTTSTETSLTLDLRTRSRAHAPLPVLGQDVFAATAVGFEESVARSEASRCFRCDAVYACGQVELVGGRGPADRPLTARLVGPPSGDPPAIATTGGAR